MKTKNLRVVIMAAGNYRKWTPLNVVIFKETLIERTVRLLKKYEITDIWITTSELGKFNIENEFLNTQNDCSLACLSGAEELKGDIYLFGDVFFSEDAIHQIIFGETNYYGRKGASKIKSHGEFFAFKTHNDFWKIFHDFLSWCNASGLKKIWSWKLLLYHQHVINGSTILPLKCISKDILSNENTNWTDINDYTDDFDNIDELNIWINNWKDFINE